MIRIAKVEDIDRLNEIANHSAVFPFIGGGESPIDFTAAFDLHRIYISEFGAIMFFNTGGAVWSFHTMFLPEGRGRHALKVAKFAALDMFTATNAMELVTLTPENAPHARPPLTFGFRPWFKSKHGQMYRLNVLDWIMKAKSLREKGQECPAKSSHLGALKYMSLAGNIDKGLMIYNSFAICAGHAPKFKDEKTENLTCRQQ